MKITIARINIILITLCFLLVGCQKEEIINNTSTEEDDPIEIDYPFFTGFITDESGDFVPETTIEVYQGGVLIGTTSSRDDGSYSTIDIPVASSKRVHLYTKKEGMVSKLKVVPAEQDELNLSIYSEEGTFFPLAFDSPGDTTLIKVSGTILTESGLPAAAVVFGLYDVYEGDNGVFYASGSLVYTDPNGYYEYYVPNDRHSNFFAFERYCSKQWLNEAEDFIAGGLGIDVIEQTAQDTILPTLTNARDLNVLDVTVSGVLLNCDGSAPVAQDTFRMKVRDEQINSELLEIVTDETGSFQGTVKICSDVLYYEIWNDDGLIFQSDAIQGTDVNLGDINVCTPVRYENGSAIIKISNGSSTTFGFDDFVATIIGDRYEVTSNSIGELIFTVDSDNQVSVESFSFLRDDFGTTYTASEEDVTESTMTNVEDGLAFQLISAIQGADGTDGSVTINIGFND